MTINKRWLRKTAESMRVLISKEQECLILERFREEPEPYEWSEQDIFTQIRNFLGCGEFVKAMKLADGQTCEGAEVLFDGEIF